MDDKIMYVWSVIESEPYEPVFTKDVCARKETAEYLQAWYEANEHNRIFDIAVRHYPDNHSRQNLFIASIGKVVYWVEESEVIL